MKKLIIMVLLMALACNIFAAVGDVEITIVIPADKVAEFSAGFLEVAPIPTVPDPNDPGDISKAVPQHTKKQWIKLIIRRYLLAIYFKGKGKLADKAKIIDPNVIQE
jgi:hypothetical protein